MSKLPLLLSFMLLAAGGIRAQEQVEEPVAIPEVTPEAEKSANSAEGEPESPVVASGAPVMQSEDLASMESKIGSEVVIEGVVAN
jgi:hypothetical protein